MHLSWTRSRLAMDVITGAAGRQIIHVVVSCKSRKTLPIPRGLLMSSISKRALDERVATWIQALQSVDAPHRRAADLYAGDHWNVVLKIPEVAPRLTVKLWVVSAGY